MIHQDLIFIQGFVFRDYSWVRELIRSFCSSILFVEDNFRLASSSCFWSEGGFRFKFKTWRGHWRIIGNGPLLVDILDTCRTPNTCWLFPVYHPNRKLKSIETINGFLSQSIPFVCFYEIHFIIMNANLMDHVTWFMWRESSLKNL